MDAKKAVAVRPRLGRRTAKEALAANLKLFMFGKWTSKTLAIKDETSKRTIDNMLNGEYDPFKHVEDIANKLETDAWVLVCPTEIIEIADVFKVYLATTDEGRGFIRFGLAAARKLEKGEPI